MSTETKTGAAAPATKQEAAPAGAVKNIRVQFVKACTLSSLGVTAHPGTRASVTPAFAEQLESSGYAVKVGF